MKKAKRLIFTVLAMTMMFSLLAIPASAAYSYDFYFDENRYDCMNVTASYAPTSSPFVQPYTSSALTTYYLAPSFSTTTWATGLLKLSSAGYRRFYYGSGYGGSGQYYKMCAYPSDLSGFRSYGIDGRWSS